MLRKGQHLFNEIAKVYHLIDFQGVASDKEGNPIDDALVASLPYVNLHQILFNMSDSEFDDMMHEFTGSNSK